MEKYLDLGVHDFLQFFVSTSDKTIIRSEYIDILIQLWGKLVWLIWDFWVPISMRPIEYIHNKFHSV
jgi:hypothetical protein